MKSLLSYCLQALAALVAVTYLGYALVDQLRPILGTLGGLLAGTR